jgi:rare lipoprotein A
MTALLFLLGCAPSLTMSKGSGSFGPREGMASYYGREFNHRKTASGERFDMNKFTAAHRELPFGTMVKVTNLTNGKSVVVRINDRGPFARGRIIDLSFAAGKALGMMGGGTARVRIEIVK